MTKRGIQAFAAGMILATAVLAAVFYLTDHDQAAAVKTEKTALTEKEVNSYLDDQQKVSVNRDDYQKLLDSKEKSLNNDQNTDDKKKKVTYKLTIKNGMSTADVSSILEKKGLFLQRRTLMITSLTQATIKKSAPAISKSTQI